MQQANSLGLHVVGENCGASDVAARPIEVRDQALVDRIAAYDHHDGNGPGRYLGSKSRRLTAAGNDQHYLSCHQFGRHDR